MLTLGDFRPDQKEDAEWLADQSEALLTLPVGYGKTPITLAALSMIKKRNPEFRVLIVSTINILKLTWGQEIAKWDFSCDQTYAFASGTPKKRLKILQSKPDFLGVNFEALQWFYDRVDEDPSLLPDVLVIDESDAMKDHSAKRVKRHCGFGGFGKGYVPRFKRRFALSATPTPEGYIGLWAQECCISWMNRLGPNITSFRRTYCDVRWNGTSMIYSVPPENEARIDERLSPILRTSKKEKYLDIPDPIYEKITLPWTDEARAEYLELEKHFVLDLTKKIETIGEERGLSLHSIEDLERAGLANILAPNIGVLFNKLRQACSGFVYDKVKNARLLSDPYTKIDALRDYIERTAGAPLVVFTQFRAEAAMIKEAFPHTQMGLPDSLEAWDAGEIKLMQLHPKSASHGINLQSQHLALWYSIPWPYVQWHQANGRLQRTGQKHQVSIAYFLRESSIENDVWRKLQGKHKTLSRFVNAIRERSCT